MRLLSALPTLPVLSLLFLSAGLTADATPTSLSPRFPVSNGGAAGLHLTSTTFYPTTHKGAWLVEFYSPYCPHCQKFAPTWDDVTKMSEHLADSSEFRMARVDGTAQMDLCHDQKVKYFPTVRLYYDGRDQGDYKGPRTYDDLMSYVKAKAEWYRVHILVQDPMSPPKQP